MERSASGRTRPALWQKGQRKLHPQENTVQATLPGKSRSVIFCNPYFNFFVSIPTTLHKVLLFKDKRLILG